MITVEQLKNENNSKFNTIKHKLNKVNSKKTFYQEEINIDKQIWTIVEEFYTFCSINKYISKSFVLQSIRNSIDFETKNENLIERVLNYFNIEIKSNIHYMIIKGIKFSEMEFIEIGKHKVFPYSKIKENIQGVDYKKVLEWINKNFENEYVIVGEYIGEIKKTEEQFIMDSQDTLNILRLMASMSSINGFNRSSININLKHNYSSTMSERFTITNRKFLTISYKYNTADVEAISSEIYFDYYNNLLKPLNEIYKADRLTQTEQIIKNFIHWVGEAQNEIDAENSFIKYCIALENIFSLKRTDVNKYFYKGIVGTIHVSSYKYELDEFNFYDIEKSSKKIKDYYDKRSKIVHDGKRDIVSFSDLKFLNYISYMTLLHLLDYKDESIDNIVMNSINCYKVLSGEKLGVFDTSFKMINEFTL